MDITCQNVFHNDKLEKTFWAQNTSLWSTYHSTKWFLDTLPKLYDCQVIEINILSPNDFLVTACIDTKYPNKDIH